MADFLTQIDAIAKNAYHSKFSVPVAQFARTGDLSLLEALRKQKYEYWTLSWFSQFWKKMGAPGKLSDPEKRCLYAAGALGTSPLAMEWLRPYLTEDPPPDERHHEALVEAFGGDAQARHWAAVGTIDQAEGILQHKSGTPTSAGRFLLSLSDEELAAAGERADSTQAALAFLLQQVTDRVPAFADSFLREGDSRYRFLSANCCRLLAEADAAKYEPILAAAATKEVHPGRKMEVLQILADRFPKRYRETTRQACLQLLAGDTDKLSFNDPLHAAQWLLATYGLAVVPELAPLLGGPHVGAVASRVLDELVAEHGPAAAPAAVLTTGHRWPNTRRGAIAHLISWPQLDHEQVIESRLHEGLANNDSLDLVQYVSLIGRWHPERFTERLWKLLEDKSKPVRMAAARALGKLGDAAVPTASELLSAKKAAVRTSAVAVLAAVQSPNAAAALEARLDEEADDEVRDQMLMALENVWEQQGKKISRADIDSRIERAAPKFKEPVVKWLDYDRLPALTWLGIKPERLSSQAVRYLLYRQSRAKEIRPDVEVKPMLALVDRATSGEFGLYVLQSFLGSAQAAEDRWALAVAGLLGDDRCVSLLMQAIRKWVDANRGKLAEYAAQALALIASDVALCAVDALSIRYRSKQKNIGKAAGEAFAEAAERLGVTPDELGDRVVPWLGFEPGAPRVIEHGDKKLEVRVSLDHKIEFRDLAKGKKVASLPASFPAEVKAEFKDLGATLREVVKGQLVRIENLMVRQFRWPVARWRELYLNHPLLFPFAARMIWGVYDDSGQLVKAFRALEDRTLTDEQDEAVEIPASGQIGLVHPLELSPEARQGWATHLADYNIQSPILQIERPVVFPKPEERGIKLSPQHKGADLNGMTFKGRAERLGWQRGSVTDGGGISSYRKCFPGAGADALLEIEGMYIGMGMEETIKLGRFAFVKSGSVAFGSYVYDEPADEKDARLVSFGEVPPIVFSETMGDLAKIVGGKAEAEE